MINTTLCYIEKDDEYLCLHRTKKENDLNEGKWIGIGGKFKDKESPEDCLLREVYEETGLILNNYRYRGLVTFVSDAWPTEYMHLFTATEFEGELRECDEGALKWIKKEELLNKTIWEGDRIFLKLLEKDAPFFSLKLCYIEDKLMYAALNGKEIIL